MKKILSLVISIFILTCCNINISAFYDDFAAYESNINKMHFNFMLGDGIYTDEQLHNYELYSYDTIEKQEIKYLLHMLDSFPLSELEEKNAENNSLTVSYGFLISIYYDNKSEDDPGVVHYAMSGSYCPYYQCVEWAWPNKTYPSEFYSSQRYYRIEDDSMEKFIEAVRAIKSGEFVIDDREITTEPSSWAKKDVDSAIKNNLVPKWNQIYYRYNINRYEVCQLTANYLAENGFTRDKWPYNDIAGNSLMLWYPSDQKQTPLSDINDDSVNCLYGCGIIEGKDERKIYPYDYITREEFAKILSKAYHFINGSEQTANSGRTYTDSEKISAWAKEYVDEMTALGVLNGKDGGCFDPKGEITKEEVIISLLRLNSIT